jgi:hypothetical protein
MAGSTARVAVIAPHVDPAEPSCGAGQGCVQRGTVDDVGGKAGRPDPFGREFLGEPAEPLR